MYPALGVLMVVGSEMGEMDGEAVRADDFGVYMLGSGRLRLTSTANLVPS